MSYFLIAVSTRENLELCLRYALAGFTSSGNGLWTFVDIQEGDFVSFLYGARVFNLYQVARKAAYKNADQLPPWPPVTFQPSGLTYYFPFRLELRPIRLLEEPLVRAEFAYVAENLLLRGGYRKTHFQADQTTLQAVSEMGRPFRGHIEELPMNAADTFVPQLTRDKANARIPEVFLFRELFLQALTRQYLGSAVELSRFLQFIGVSVLHAQQLEVLGEKAFPEGHVDLLIKESTPKGLSRKIVVEVKMGNASARDLQQLKAYMLELGEECLAGVLIAESIPPRVSNQAEKANIVPLRYRFDDPLPDPASYDELMKAFRITA